MADPTWVDGVTPLNSANMTKLQTRDERGVPNGYAPLGSDSKVPAPNLPDISGTYQAVAQKGQPSGYVGIDASGGISTVAGTYPSLYVHDPGEIFLDPNGNQRHIWFGPGQDTSLSRYAAGILTTPGTLFVGLGSAPGSNGLYVFDNSAAGQPRITVMNNGIIGFGSGSAQNDTWLHRGGANSLMTDGQFTVGTQLNVGGPTLHGSTVYINDSLGVDGNTPYWAKYGALSLQTNSQVRLNGALFVDLGGGGNPIYFGPAADTTLARYAANQLRTPGDFLIGGNLYTGGQITSQSTGNGFIWNAPAGAGAGYAAFAIQHAGDPGFKFEIYDTGQIAWGTGTVFDAYILRPFAGALQSNAWWLHLMASPTDQCFGAYATGDANPRFYIDASGKQQWGPGPTGPDTNLYRLVAGRLRTDQSLDVVKNLRVGIDNASKIYFGSTDDTNLYRSAANQLATDSGFVINASNAFYVNFDGVLRQVIRRGDGVLIA